MHANLQKAREKVENPFHNLSLSDWLKNKTCDLIGEHKLHEHFKTTTKLTKPRTKANKHNTQRSFNNCSTSFKFG